MKYEAVRRILERHPDVRFAYLFGSAAAGRQHRLSDVDIGVYLDSSGPRADRRVLDERWVELAAALQRAVPDRDVDVILLQRAPPLLADRIARSGQVLFSRDEPARIRWLADVKSRYCDLQPLRRLLDGAVVRRVREGRFGLRDG